MCRIWGEFRYYWQEFSIEYWTLKIIHAFTKEYVKLNRFKLLRMYFSFYIEFTEYGVELGTIGKNSVQNIGHYK